MASLRQTIATPATPLIETIQNVVSTMRTVTASKPLQNEQEVTSASEMATDANESSTDYEIANEVR